MVSQKKWTELPKLTRERLNHSSCSFNDRFVYVFGGHINSFVPSLAQSVPTLTNSIERLDMLALDDPKTVWQPLFFTLTELPIFPNPCITQVNGEKLCLFSTGYCFYLEHESNKVTESKKYPSFKTEVFKQPVVITQDDICFTYDTKSKQIIKFSHNRAF